MNPSSIIVRHELPRNEYRFTIQAYGFRPLSLQVEDDCPVIYEIAVLSPDDNKEFLHHFIWIQTGSQLPEKLDSSSFVGTVQYSDGHVEHLFQEWRV